MGTTSRRPAATVRTAAVAVTATAISLASATPALASPHASAKFKVSGIVTAVHGGQLTVLARTERVGRHVNRDRVVTVEVTRLAHGGSVPHTMPALRAGDAVNASGTETDGTLDATSVAAAPRPAEALIGVVDSVSGTLVTLTSRDRANGATTQHETDGHDRPLVDVAGALFSGAAASAADLAPGMTIVALGEEWHDTMAAARIYAFTTAPALAVGHVSAADPTAKSLTVDVSGDGGDQQGDNTDSQTSTSDQTTTSGSSTSSTDPSSTDATAGSTTSGDSSQPAAPTTVTVDASNADVIANGNDGQQAVTFPAPDDKVLVVGTAGTTADTISAALVFTFDGHDHGSVGHNDD